METIDCENSNPVAADHSSRKRKSRFDIAPPTIGEVPTTSEENDQEYVPSAPPTSSFTMFHDVLPPPLPTPSVMTAQNDSIVTSFRDDSSNPLLSALSSKVNIKQAKSETGEVISYVSVVEKFYEERLAKAMQKNFSYIDRKDEYALLIIANGGDPFDQSLYPSFKKGSKLTMDMFSKNKVDKSTAVNKPGVGAAPTSTISSSESKTQATKLNEVLSVYVSNLPTDITEEELEILFSPQGKIKKIKIYTDGTGKKKGDALITFANSDSVILSCGKLNRLDIGDGHIIGVTKANFGSKTGDNTTVSKEEPSDGAKEIKFTKSTQSLHSVTSTMQMDNAFPISGWDSESIRAHVPIESEMDKYPVVLIFNGYDVKQALVDEVYVNTVEMDLLLMCCEFGNVRIIQLFQLINGQDAESRADQHGLIAVTFDNKEAAVACTNKLHKGRFQERVISTCLLLPHENIPSTSVTDVGQTTAMVECSAASDSTVINSSATIVSTTLIEDELKYNEEAENVEDFLNSLL